MWKREIAGGSLLVIHQGAIGDFILALPVLSVLRKQLPVKRCVLMGYPGILELARKRYYADETVSIDQKGMASFFLKGSALDLDLSRFIAGFDWLVVFGTDRSCAMVENLRRVFSGTLLHIESFPEAKDRVHLADHYLNVLRKYGFSIDHEDPRIYLTDEDRQWCRSYLQRLGLAEADKSRTVILHPGSGSRKKVWPVRSFVDLIKQLDAAFVKNVLVVLGPAEPDATRKAFENIGAGSIPVKAVENLALVELASVMEGCALFVGNDSGITHLAASLGVPTVAIFGPSDPVVWAPRGVKVAVVRKGVSCSPCSREDLQRCSDPECLRTIEVEDIINAIQKLEIPIRSQGKE